MAKVSLYLLVISIWDYSFPNAKWNEHLENMITNITKHLGILRKLKCSLNRSNLEKMYLVYIRPLFEYACEVWDNCGIGYSDKLENIKLDAARIVTGLPIFLQNRSIYMLRQVRKHYQSGDITENSIFLKYKMWNGT